MSAVTAIEAAASHAAKAKGAGLRLRQDRVSLRLGDHTGLHRAVHCALEQALVRDVLLQGLLGGDLVSLCLGDATVGDGLRQLGFSGRFLRGLQLFYGDAQRFRQELLVIEVRRPAGRRARHAAQRFR